MFQIDKEKIDIVYCWVDGNEEAYKKKKAELKDKLGINGAAVNPCRFINNDELKYSLRSLEKYANWINNIYIVTNNQCPQWLNLDNPRVHLINQADIMPEGSQPCFNSIAIEHCIVNIPNLSEYFLYANDDNLFFDSVSPKFFFKNGKPIYRVGHTYREIIHPYVKYLMNAEELVYKKYKKRYNRFPHHNIEPYRKSDLKDCYNIFKEEIDKTIFSPFRAESDIEKSIYANFCMATGRGYEKNVNNILKVILHIYTKDSINCSISVCDIEDKIKKHKPKLLCINDDEKTTNEDRLRFKDLLESLFPQKSQFEI